MELRLNKVKNGCKRLHRVDLKSYPNRELWWLTLHIFLFDNYTVQANLHAPQLLKNNLINIKPNEN